jgi:hypothetical protein
MLVNLVDKQIYGCLHEGMDDWESREPCPDGRCTGVLGPEGRCGTCGTSRDGRKAVAATTERSVAPTDDEWADRTPCRDGSCVGVLGADGVCGTCGKKF